MTIKTPTEHSEPVPVTAPSASDEPNEPRDVTYDIAPAAIIKIVLTIAAIWLLIHVWNVIILVTLALMLVATFNPLVRKLQVRLGRSWAIVGVVSGLVLLFLGTIALLMPPLLSQASALIQRTPQYIQQLQQMLAKHGMHVNLQRQMLHLSGNMDGAAPQVVGLLSGVVSWVTAFATVAILTIYLLIEGPQVATSMTKLLPRDKRLGARRLVAEIGLQIGGYMRGQLITSALAGAFSFLTLWFVGVPEALALGALAAIADAIPMIGLLIAVLPAALMALTLSPIKAVVVLVAYLVYHQLESNFIGPKVYGNALGLSLSVIVISLLVGAELMGILGALLALPVAAAIPSIAAYIQEWQESRDSAGAVGHLP